MISPIRIYKFFIEYVFDMIFFSTGKLRTCFGPIRNLFPFSTAQTEKNSWKNVVKTSDEFVINHICDYLITHLEPYHVQILPTPIFLLIFREFWGFVPLLRLRPRLEPHEWQECHRLAKRPLKAFSHDLHGTLERPDPRHQIHFHRLLKTQYLKKKREINCFDWKFGDINNK